MNLRPINAPDAPQPAGGYAQALEVTGASRLLFISGQIPATADGVVPAGFEAQARLCWKNVETQLAAAGMTLDNVVKATIFLADRSFAIPNRTVRNEVLAGRQISLTVIICTIFDERWLLEIEAVAAA
jgi:enamine deaminase RidA (YjgF/YER057c/UK114 family)